MVGCIILVCVVLILGMLAHQYSVRGVISLNEFSEEELRAGRFAYLAWISRCFDGAPIGTKTIYPNEKSMDKLRYQMDLEFAAAISRSTKFHLYMYRDGDVKIQIKS